MFITTSFFKAVASGLVPGCCGNNQKFHIPFEITTDDDDDDDHDDVDDNNKWQTQTGRCGISIRFVHTEVTQ